MSDENTCIECLYYREEGDFDISEHCCYVNPGERAVRLETGPNSALLPLACRFKRDQRVPAELSSHKAMSAEQRARWKAARVEEATLSLDMAFDECAKSGKAHIDAVAKHLVVTTKTVRRYVELHGGIAVNNSILSRVEPTDA